MCIFGATEEGRFLVPGRFGELGDDSGRVGLVYYHAVSIGGEEHHGASRSSVSTLAA